MKGWKWFLTRLQQRGTPPAPQRLPALAAAKQTPLFLLIGARWVGTGPGWGQDRDGAGTGPGHSHSRWRSSVLHPHTAIFSVRSEAEKHQRPSSRLCHSPSSPHPPLWPAALWRFYTTSATPSTQPHLLLVTQSGSQYSNPGLCWSHCQVVARIIPHLPASKPASLHCWRTCQPPVLAFALAPSRIYPSAL